MMSTKTLVQAILGSAILATSSFGVCEEVAATSKASSSLIPGKPFSTLMLRNTAGDDAENQARLYLGTKTFGDKVETTLVFGAVADADSPQVRDRGTRLESQANLFVYDFAGQGSVTVGPWFEAHAPTTKHQGKALVAGILEAKYGVDTDAGKFEVYGYGQFGAWFGAGPQRANVVDASGNAVEASASTAALSLTADKDSKLQTRQTTPSLGREGQVGLSYAPMKSLKFYTETSHEAILNPTYVYNSAANSVEMKRTGGALDLPSYTTKGETWQNISAKVAINDMVSVSNEFNVSLDAPAAGKSRGMKNLLSLSVNLL